MSKARDMAEIISYTDALTTSSIEESGNLYFTNQRGIDSGSATYILQTDQQSILNSASATADANSNLYSDIKNLESIITASAAAVAYADGLTTTDVAEGTSLYYTTLRGQETASTMFVHGNHTNVSAQYVSGEIRFISSAAGGGEVTTGDVTESTNLYFTNERAVGAGSATYLTQSSASATYIPLSASASLGGGSEPNFSSVFMLGGM